MKLKEIGEAGLLSHLAKTFDIGDDAYIIPYKDKSFLFCCDTSYEGIHFDRALSSFYEIGYRACSSCISDIAAMGGIPLYALVSLGTSKEEGLSQITELYAGMQDIASSFNMKIVGGDTIASERLIITISILGEAEKPITRDKAKIGDLIGVTGKLGGARRGLLMLKEKIDGFELLKQRYLRPFPRIKEGLILKEFATSMIDISDGLFLDLERLSFASNNGMSIKKELIPIEDGASFEDVFYSDDYELLFTFPPNKNIDFATIIGEVIEKQGVFLDKERIDVKGYEHFREA